MPTTAAFGSWTSPLTPESFSKGNCATIWELQTTEDGGVFWTEQTCRTGERRLFYRKEEGQPMEQWAKGMSVKSSVHEYGGGSFQPTPEGGVVFSTSNGLYEQSSSSESPVLLIDSKNNTLRFADFSITPSHIFCVLESHQLNEQYPENSLVSIDRKTKERKSIARGADFYAYPRVSPSGRFFVWMEWSHINMPWDETTIQIAEITLDGSIKNQRILRSGVGKNINYYCPTWNSEKDELFLVHDATNFWNVYRIEFEKNGGSREENVYPIEKEIGHPLWFLGDRSFSVCGERIAMRVGNRLYFGEGNSVRDLSTPGFEFFSHISVTSKGDVFCIASGPKKSSTLLKITPGKEAGKMEIIREALSQEDLEQFDISEPEKIAYSSDGIEVHGYFYEPKNRDFVAPAGTLPPVILYGHGGPTECARPSLDLRKQFFTTRGFAVFDVDYRGSAGYGSEFRNSLKKQLGIYDRDDMINVAKLLISTGRVDPDKVAIMGSSAGGFLLLNCLVASDVFKAAVSLWGVADVAVLSKITHKFERCYNEVLIGKYPEEKEIYYERTPTHHIEKISAAVAFLHGREDTVVPVSQSVELYEELKKRGRTTAIQVYENEGHGFRGEEAVRKSNEAAYYFLCRTMGIEPTISSDIEIVNLPAASL